MKRKALIAIMAVVVSGFAFGQKKHKVPPKPEPPNPIVAINDTVAIKSIDAPPPPPPPPPPPVPTVNEVQAIKGIPPAVPKAPVKPKRPSTPREN